MLVKLWLKINCGIGPKRRSKQDWEPLPSFRYLSFPRAITLLSVRGRGARRFFDSVPGVSQPGDGLQAACWSLPSVVLGSSQDGERASRRRVCTCAGGKNRQVSTRAVASCDPRATTRDPSVIPGFVARTLEKRVDRPLARLREMRKARDARGRQVTRSR